MRWLASLVLLAACEHPQPGLDVVVTAADSGAAIKEAVVAIVCDLVAVNGAAITDAEGHAHVTVFTETFDACTLTVSHIQFDPAQLRDLEICPPETVCEPLAIALDGVAP